MAALILFTCSAFFTSLEFTVERVIRIISLLGGFESPADLSSTDEIVLRGQFFLIIWVFVLIGLAPGALLGRSFDKADARRFRKLRKKLLKRRAYGS